MNADRFNEALLSYLQGLSAKEQINLYENHNIAKWDITKVSQYHSSYLDRSD